MKRYIALAGGMLVACGVLAGASEMRGALAKVAAAVACRIEVDALATLRESQRLATADLVGRLVDGSMSLAEVVDALEDGTQGQPVLLDQLALNRDEITTRERLAGYAMDRAKVSRGDDYNLASSNVIHQCCPTGR